MFVVKNLRHRFLTFPNHIIRESGDKSNKGFHQFINCSDSSILQKKRFKPMSWETFESFNNQPFHSLWRRHNSKSQMFQTYVVRKHCNQKMHMWKITYVVATSNVSTFELETLSCRCMICMIYLNLIFELTNETKV